MKPYILQREMPKGMEEPKATAGRAGKVTRETRIRIAWARQSLYIATMMGIRFGTAQAWNAVNLPSRKKSTKTAAKDDTIITARVSAMTIKYYWVTGSCRKPAPLKESLELDFVWTTHICGNRWKVVWYTELTKKDEHDIHGFAERVAGRAIRHGDGRLKFRLPGNRKH